MSSLTARDLMTSEAVTAAADDPQMMPAYLSVAA